MNFNLHVKICLQNMLALVFPSSQKSMVKNCVIQAITLVCLAVEIIRSCE